MRLVEFFALQEGAQDEKFRNMARQAWEVVLGGAGNAERGVMTCSPEGNSIVCSIDLKRMVGNKTLVRNLELRMVLKRGGTSLGEWEAPQKSWERPAIILITKAPKGDPLDRFKWRERVEKELPSLLKQPEMRETFIHEYIHFLDWLRYSDGSDDQEIYSQADPHSVLNKRTGKRTDQKRPTDKDWKRYYNSPVETNAFVQETLSAMEDELEGKAIPSVDELYRMFLRKAMPEYLEHMDEEQKRRVKKRVYQFWQDMRKRREEEGR